MLIVSLYEGFLPRSKSALGKTFSIGAEEGLMEFEIQTQNKKKALNAVYTEVSANNGSYNSSVDEKAVSTIDCIKTQISYIPNNSVYEFFYHDLSKEWSSKCILLFDKVNFKSF